MFEKCERLFNWITKPITNLPSRDSIKVQPLKEVDEHKVFYLDYDYSKFEKCEDNGGEIIGKRISDHQILGHDGWIYGTPMPGPAKNSKIKIEYIYSDGKKENNEQENIKE